MPRHPSSRPSCGSAPPPAAAEGPPIIDDAIVDDGAFAAAMAALGPFEARPALAIAVSGGSDSMALALLASRWAAGRGGIVLPLIVDHRLRPGSGEEAALVSGRLRERGLTPRVLPWEGPKPVSRIQERAREARYRLLAEAARRGGCLHLLLGHTHEDQVETIRMRRARGPQPLGMAGMPAIRELDHLRLLRPLLGFRRAALMATLRAARLAWVSDPSNRSALFERVRVRLAGAAAGPPAVAEAASRGALEMAVARRLAAGAWFHPLGFLRLDMAALDGPATERRILLGRAIRCIAGSAYGPPLAALDRLVAMLGTDRPLRRSLGGCLIERRRAGDVLICREPARIGDDQGNVPAGRILWDGRFLIHCEPAMAGLRLRPLGAAVRVALPAELRSELRRSGVPQAAVEALPGLWWAEGLVACPPLGWAQGAAEHSRIVAELAPRNCLAGAPFAPRIVV